MPVETQEVSTTNLSVIYNRIYDIADRLFKKYNPCNIHKKGNKVVCNNNKPTNTLCCYECSPSCGSDPPHYWNNGCTIKCLPCKLYVCSYILYDYDKHGETIRKKKYMDFISRLSKLREIASKYGINTYGYYRTKNEILSIIGGRL